MWTIKRFIGKLSTIPAPLMGTVFRLHQTIEDIDDNDRPYRRRRQQQQRSNAWLRISYMMDTDNDRNGWSDDDSGDPDLTYINPSLIRTKCVSNVCMIFGLEKDEENFGMTDTNLGTGICVHKEDKLFLTNAHVVRGHEIVYLRLLSFIGLSMTRFVDIRQLLSMPLDADVLYVEDHNDLALIRLRDHPPEFGVYEAMKLCDREPQFGELVADYGNGDCFYTVFSGMINESGTIGLNFSDYTITYLPYTMDQLQVIHSATIVKGCSGGPIIDIDCNCIGINFAGSNIGGFAKPSKTMISFLERGRHYAEHEFLSTDRRNIYSMGTASDRRLGLLLEETYNGYIVIDYMINADTEIYLGEVITQVRGQPFLDIQQMRTALAELTSDSLKVELIVSTDTEDTGLTLNANLTGDELPLLF
ncbi:periplasmic serine endoprotease DegP-like [Oppia nitens]|uniref:periplasmic serine endoprotease DegP-like n=1 Tax=Oppia nitens TaxID=1686743 RepID=UPI0023D9BD82|nr:periplasmic serine endoprotease DegP-like [Oppia nitens]